MVLKVAVIGASGRMGKEIIKCVKDNNLDLSGAVDHVNAGSDSGELSGIGKNNISISSDLGSVLNNSDVLIEFTSPEATIQHLNENKENKPVVIGTTGMSNEQIDTLKEYANQFPIVFSPNMSVGVNLLFKLTELTTKILKDYDIEIIEAHHRLKKDSPSGTANKLLDVIIEQLNRNKEEHAVYGRQGMVGERTKEEVGVHAVRGGDVVGDHTVLYAGIGERIELTHKASSRQTFAKGAVRAAVWLADKQPGLYSMFDVLGL